MPPRPRPPARAGVLVAIVLSVFTAACADRDAQLEQQRKTLSSLGETTAAVLTGWLDGQLSGRFTRTALETTFRLVEQQRAALAVSPSLLQDPRGARLSETAERLSRVLAVTIQDVTAADAIAIRQHLATLPIRTTGQP